MTKQSKKGATPKGKQAPNTEKKTTKKVAPKKEVVKEVKVVEPIVIKTSPIEEQIAEVLAVDNAAKESVSETIEKVWEEISSNTIEMIDADRVAYAIQTPLTPSELEEKALEAHYASLGQIDFYNKNIKK